VQLVLAVSIFGSIGVWTVPRASNAIWGWRIGFAIAILVTGFIWYRAANRKENFPDLLAQAIHSYSYFERDGLCFAPVIHAVQGICWISIYFQNRYANPCTCRIRMLPPPRSFWFGRHDLPPINAELYCPSGAFGVTRFPYPVPQRYQGRHLRFEVFGSTDYPQGKGNMLRFREGIQAGSTSFFSITGGRGLSRIYLPRDVASSLLGPIEPTTEILWQPDLPTNAFPVIPTTPTRVQRDIGFPVNPEES